MLKERLKCIPLKPLVVAIALASTSTQFTSEVEAGGLNTQLGKVFDGAVSNVTQPGTYGGQSSRGGFYFGSVQARYPIIGAKLIDFQPPSFKAGCGGVDLDLGSLSWLSEDKVVELLNAIAQNGKGYLFQLALSSISPKIAQWTEAFRKTIDEINKFTKNSCDAAMGLVDGGLKALGKKQDTEDSTMASEKGLFTDIREAWSSTEADNPAKKLDEKCKNDVECKKAISGNLVWQELKKHNVSSWFSGGDDDMLKAMMSVTGSIVLSEAKETDHASAKAVNGNSSDAKAREVTTLSGNLLQVRDLIVGTANSNKVKVYDCKDTVQCFPKANPHKNISLEGLQIKILKALVGDIYVSTDGHVTSSAFSSSQNGSPNLSGIIGAHGDPFQSKTMSDDEKKLMYMLPHGYATMMRNISMLDPRTAANFAEEISKALAVEMSVSTFIEVKKAAIDAARLVDSTYAEQLRGVFRDSNEEIERGIKEVREEFGTPADIRSKYKMVVDAIEKNTIAAELLRAKE